MRRIVKHRSQLPPWFSLENYEGLKDLALADWLRQLSARAELMTAALPLHKYQLDRLHILRSQPIISAAIAEDNLCSWHAQLNAQLEDDPLGGAPVCPMTLSDLLRVEQDIGEDHLVYARDLVLRYYYGGGLDVLDPAVAIQAMQERHELDRPVDGWSAHHAKTSLVVVNLTLPDAVLIQSFRDLLPRLREQVSFRRQGPVPTNARVAPEEWVRIGVLPYLDLRLWANETSHRITNRTFADAIFPPGEGGEEIVRKTTSKVAAELMTNAFLQRLLAAAVDEIRNV